MEPYTRVSQHCTFHFLLFHYARSTTRRILPFPPFPYLMCTDLKKKREKKRMCNLACTFLHTTKCMLV